MPRIVRFCALVAPALMLIYGLLRVVDGRDGIRHNSPAWDIGHIAFLVAVILFAVFAVAVRGFDRPAVPWQRVVIDAAVIATLAGAVCFAWVILGDLIESFQQSAPLPDALQIPGPALFEVGLLILLVRLVVLRRLPAWSPIAVLAGFAAIAVTLDLLPLGSLLVGLGLLPLARPRRARIDTRS